MTAVHKFCTRPSSIRSPSFLLLPCMTPHRLFHPSLTWFLLNLFNFCSTFFCAVDYCFCCCLYHQYDWFWCELVCQAGQRCTRRELMEDIQAMFMSRSLLTYICPQNLGSGSLIILLLEDIISLGSNNSTNNDRNDEYVRFVLLSFQPPHSPSPTFQPSQSSVPRKVPYLHPIVWTS